MLLLALAGTALPGGAVVLARGGQARCRIVLARDAGPELRETADDLARTLTRISGAPFAVTVDAGGSAGIFLGTRAHFPRFVTPDVARALAMRNRYDGVEAYAIRTRRDGVLLLGNTAPGATHAAYRLLHALGCRWFFPAQAWTVIPRADPLAVDLRVDDRPALLARRIWYEYAFVDNPLRDDAERDYRAWARRNGMAASFTPVLAHAWHVIVSRRQALFDAHPEWFSLVNGKRDPSRLKFCISNPEVRRVVVDYAVRYFTEHPDADMVSLEPSDGGGHCECDACRRLGSISDAVFLLVNEAARAVRARYPGKMVGCLAYNLHSAPPSFPLEPNVYVQLTNGFTFGKLTFAELLERWAKIGSARFGVYEYYSVHAWDHDLPGVSRASSIPYLAASIRRYARLGATSLDCEAGNNWGLHGRGYYLANRLMWNPAADVAALSRDFYAKAFGPAAAPMQRYYARLDWDRLDSASAPLLGEDLYARALRDLAEATRLAAGRPDVLARLDALKSYWRYVQLREDGDRATDPAAKKALYLAALTHAYRDRYLYMNHWEALRCEWTPQLVEEFKEPTWHWQHAPAGEQPWRVEAPYTPEERAAFFADLLARYRPGAEIPVRAFSRELAPVVFAGLPPQPSRYWFGGLATFAVCSLDGAPVRCTLTTATFGYGDTLPDLRYTLTDARGRTVAAGRLSTDARPHVLALAVPKPGCYWLDVDDSSAGWNLDVPADQRFSLALRRDRFHSHYGAWTPLYFYVPKGTREIVYYANCNPHQVVRPDGVVAREVNAQPAYIRVPVPPGMDGKPWSFLNLIPRHLWLCNVPNYLSRSPAGLLVPREVAVADGLAPASPAAGAR